MENLFDINDLLKDESSKGIPVGVQQDVAVTSIARGSSPNNNKFVKIEFSKDGGKLSKTLWEPKGSYPEEGETLDEAKRREGRTNLQVIGKLLKIFLSPEELASFPKLDYEPFIDKAIAVLTPKLKNKTVNIKVVYDKKGEYTELSRYDFIEEHVPNTPPTLELSTWELENRMTKKREKNASTTNEMEKFLTDDDPFA